MKRLHVDAGVVQGDSASGAVGKFARVAGGVKPKSVRRLASGSTSKWTVTGRTLRVITPPIGLHEAVALDL